MGKSITVILPDGTKRRVYASNNKQLRQEAEQKFNQQHNVELNLSSLARQETRNDLARQEYKTQVNSTRPDWAKNIKNWDSLSSRTRRNVERRLTTPQPKQVPTYAKNIKNWDKLTPSIQAKITRQAGYTKLGGDLYTIDRKGTLATKKASQIIQKIRDKEYSTQRTAMITQAQQDLKKRIHTKLGTTQEGGATKYGGLNAKELLLTKKIEASTKKQEQIDKRRRALKKNTDLSIYFGTADTKAGRIVQKSLSTILSAPFLLTGGVIDYIDLVTKKIEATAVGLYANTKDTINELGRSAKETPKETLNIVKDLFTTTEGLTTLAVGGILFAGAGGGFGKGNFIKPVKVKPPKVKPPKGQTTLPTKFKKLTAEQSKTKKQINSIYKKVETNKIQIKKLQAELENNFGRKLTKKEIRSLKKTKNTVSKNEINNILKDILKRETTLKRKLSAKEKTAIIKQRLTKHNKKEINNMYKNILKNKGIKIIKPKGKKVVTSMKPSFIKKYGKRSQKLQRKKFRKIAKNQLIAKRLKVKESNRISQKSKEVIRLAIKELKAKKLGRFPKKEKHLKGVKKHLKGKPLTLFEKKQILRLIKEKYEKGIFNRNEANKYIKLFNLKFKKKSDGLDAFRLALEKFYKKTGVMNKKGQSQLLRTPQLLLKPKLKVREASKIKAARSKLAKRSPPLIPKGGRVKPSGATPKVGVRGRVKIRAPRLRYFPPLGLASSQVLELSKPPIELLRDVSIQRGATKVKVAQKVAQAQQQGQQQGQKLKSGTVTKLATTTALTSLAIQRYRKTGKKPVKKPKQSSIYYEREFNNAVYRAKRTSKGIYLPDLYALLTDEKVSRSKATMYVNPMKVFSGLEARPIIG